VIAMTTVRISGIRAYLAHISHRPAQQYELTSANTESLAHKKYNLHPNPSTDGRLLVGGIFLEAVRVV
jgi:hypothetical protein